MAQPTPSPSDPRITAYRASVRHMRQGKFDVEFPIGCSDDVGRLGRELEKLAFDLELQFDNARRIQQATDHITGGLFLDDVLDKVFDHFAQLIPYDRLGYAMLSDDQQHVSAYWARSLADKIKLGVGFTAAMKGSSLQTIIDTGRPRIINDLAAHLERNPESVSTRLMLEEGVRSSLTCPLIAHGKPIGFIFFSSFQINTYQDLHQGLFLRLATQLSLLIEKSRLYQELFEVNQELSESMQLLEQQATHDALTGLYNRKAILDILDLNIQRAKRNNDPVSIIMIDVDLFKRINDVHGHLMGDAALAGVAACLQAKLRGYNSVGRYGGEEFLIVLDRVDSSAAESIADRLRLAVAELAVPGLAPDVRLTISAGVGVADTSAEISALQILSVADHALYDAKQNGRNRVEARHVS